MIGRASRTRPSSQVGRACIEAFSGVPISFWFDRDGFCVSPSKHNSMNYGVKSIRNGAICVGARTRNRRQGASPCALLSPRPTALSGHSKITSNFVSVRNHSIEGTLFERQKRGCRGPNFNGRGPVAMAMKGPNQFVTETVTAFETRQADQLNTVVMQPGCAGQHRMASQGQKRKDTLAFGLHRGYTFATQDRL